MTGSASTGGLYADVAPGDMVDEFNDWCFDASRKPGDTGIVQTEFGFHVMYFVKNVGADWKINVDSALRSDAYSTYLTGRAQEVSLHDQQFWHEVYRIDRIMPLFRNHRYAEALPGCHSREVFAAKMQNIRQKRCRQN